jgi:riboflavin kinase/FMN adenylyltransferase
VDNRRVDGRKSLGASPGTTLIAIGNFDGVHRGHRAVLESAAARARLDGLLPIVLTFDPHPAVVLGKSGPSLLTALDRRIELIGRVAPEIRVVVEPFTLELSKLSARAFVEELLLRDLGARVVLVGKNFRFGHGREGDVALLERVGNELGFSAVSTDLVADASGPLSSSRVRKAIAAGDLGDAQAVLGRPHALSGRVVRGDGRGRTIGVPTANLESVLELRPPNGVYACLVDHVENDGSAKKLGIGAVNIGVRPTVGAGPSVEVHVLDFDRDLYGQTLRLHLVERLREERRFAGIDELVAQIRRDLDAARQTLADRKPDPSAGGAWH